mmetsp:Transcript_3390/g.8201  ORF Transcript_3390/g.8201 Transcript_3390/m.8201 type:complete len:257 (+) Transcript_3390:1299-2069(+)
MCYHVQLCVKKLLPPLPSHAQSLPAALAAAAAAALLVLLALSQSFHEDALAKDGLPVFLLLLSDSRQRLACQLLSQALDLIPKLRRLFELLVARCLQHLLLQRLHSLLHLLCHLQADGVSADEGGDVCSRARPLVVDRVALAAGGVRSQRGPQPEGREALDGEGGGQLMGSDVELGDEHVWLLFECVADLHVGPTHGLTVPAPWREELDKHVLAGVQHDLLELLCRQLAHGVVGVDHVLLQTLLGQLELRLLPREG